MFKEKGTLTPRYLPRDALGKYSKYLCHATLTDSSKSANILDDAALPPGSNH